MQNHTTFVPNVAVRFDYSLTGVSATGAAVSPFVSIYYTDRATDNTFTPAKATRVNLAVAQGVSYSVHHISHPWHPAYLLCGHHVHCQISPSKT